MTAASQRLDPGAIEAFSRAVISVEASRLPESERGRAERLADLIAWCGEGDLTPNQVHAYLRQDGTGERPRAAGLLLQGPDGRRYLATACHVLSDPEDSAPQPMLGLDASESVPDEASDAGWQPMSPRRGMTELAFDETVFRFAGKADWFPALSFPHLDLALIRLDDGNAAVCSALDAAGFAFIDPDRIGDEPTCEGAEIHVLGPAPRVANGAVGETGTLSRIEARVSGLSQSLSFFWTDAAVPGGLSAAPVVERDKIVGFVSPQLGSAGAADRPSAVASYVATVAKAIFLKHLFEADQGAFRP